MTDLLRDGTEPLLIAISMLSLAYFFYCLVRAVLLRIRIIGHVKRWWMVPLFLVAPYSIFLTDAGRALHAASGNWLMRGFLVAMAGLFGMMLLLLLLPRPQPWCAGSTPEAPRLGCPAAVSTVPPQR